MTQSFDESRMPVLVGVGQLTDRQPVETAHTPVELMAQAAELAAADAGPGQALLDAVDTLIAVGLTVDSPEAKNIAAGMYRNPPLTVSNRLGIKPSQLFYTTTGGNTPQMVVNQLAEHIADGELEVALLTGAEALNTMIGRLKKGLDLNDWQDDPGSDPQTFGSNRSPCSEHEKLYGLETPATTYPLFENALRGKYGLDLQAHQKKLGELYHRFSAVAASNSLAWFPNERSAVEIAQVSENNRYVGFPYTKYLNSIIQVNMGAALILTSVSRARELGVPEDKLVYLHGCADGNDIWHLSERRDYHSSPAMRCLGEKALAMAGKSIEDMSHFDLYSCFPSAVQIACDELGIAHDDPRGHTVTGGLPYFGGPGNNYVTHSIASMVQRLRAHPGDFGLLNANGWFVTKHSLGIYSTTPPSDRWQREKPAQYQDSILDQTSPGFTEVPSGPASIETYTVLHSRKGVERALVIGRQQDGTRFFAETPDDAETLQGMMQQDMLGAPGEVSSGTGKNLFRPRFN